MLEHSGVTVVENPIQTQAVDRLIQPIGLEKSRLHPSLNGRTLSDIATQIGLSEHLPQPEQQLQQLGLNLPDNLSQRRKGDILTTLAAHKLVATYQSPESTITASLLLATNYPSQAELGAVVKTAQLTDNSQGKEIDLRHIRQSTSDNLANLVEAGKIDRLTAACIARLCQERGLTSAQANRLAKSFDNRTLSPDPAIVGFLPELHALIKISSRLRSGIPKAGLKPDDLAYSRLASISFGLAHRANSLRDLSTARTEINQHLEQNRVPESIRSLSEILTIVDQNPEIQAVSFDLYDTLVQWTEDFFDRFNRFPHRALKHFNRIGVNIDEKQLSEANGQVWGDMWRNYQINGQEVPIENTMSELMRRIAPNLDPKTPEHQILLNSLIKEYYRGELENAVAMPGAKQTLEELHKRGIKICLTSNASWSLAHVHRVLNRFGLKEYFDAISISSEIGIMKKPNKPEFFQYSWQKLGLPNNSVLHVGDNPRDDVMGARNAGGKATHYFNPVAYNRLEIDKKSGTFTLVREQNPQLYSETVVHMQQNSLEQTASNWIDYELNKLNISEAEKDRIRPISELMYQRSRDIISPVYLNLAEDLLQNLNQGNTNLVLCLARDGLAISAAMKLMRHLDRERYPNVRSDQIKYLQSSRGLLRRVVNPQSAEDQRLRQQYLYYLGEKRIPNQGRITVTDIVSGEGTNYRLIKELLSPANVDGLFVDVLFSPGPDKRSFLQESLGITQPILNLDTLLFHLESIYNGPHTTVKDFNQHQSTQGLVVNPKMERKKLPPHVLTRGLSEESVLFINQVAIRGLMDAVRIRTRSRQAGIPDPTSRQVTMKFAQFMQNAPVDDLRLSVPWQDGGAWFLPSQNEFEDARIPKGNVLLQKPN